MELMFFRPNEFERLYNCFCSLIRVDDVPLEERVGVINGLILLTLFFILELLYIPCMFSFWNHMDKSCYKILFYIGITDMSVLWIVAFFSGYFSLTGYVFCSNPKFMYILGTLAMGFWAAESIAELALAIDRCLEMSYPEYAEYFFKGYRAWIWPCLATIYALCWIIWTKPVIFSSIYCAWFFNPFIGYVEDTESIYTNFWHSGHDIFMAFAFPVVYILLAIKLLFATWSAPANVQRSVSQKTMFLQVAIISGFNCYACLLYVLMQYIQVTQTVILMAHYGWLCIHGMPPLIFLTINKTIRNDCRKMVASLLFRMANNLNNNNSSNLMGRRSTGHGLNAQIHPNNRNSTVTGTAPAAAAPVSNGRRNGNGVIIQKESQI